MEAQDRGRVPDVVAFDEPLDRSTDAVSLLGGKGAGLAEMTRLGLPVPPGFVITTDACRRYLAAGWPDGLEARIAEHLERLAGQTGRRFGDADAPLLVSVRSGAPVSMPGMMDTILNVGMTPAIRARLAAEAGSELFAADTWLRFCRTYAEVVLGVSRAEVEAAAACGDTVEERIAAAERIGRLAAGDGGAGIPEEPPEQLRGAVEAVFRSWNSPRARVFRAQEAIDEQLGTAVTVQAMVFGNLDDRSGTGVAFTRDPATGDAAAFGDYLPRAQGEDVVAGTHVVSGLEALRVQLPEVHAELVQTLRRLELHLRDLCDVEFTVSAGKLYVLQARAGRRSPLAAVRIAVAMASETDFPLTKAGAVRRVSTELLQRVASAGAVDSEATPVAMGRATCPGVGVGVLCFDPDEAAELSRSGTAVVLAREDTSPEDVHGMVGAAGIVTTKGGVASHAAVVARGWAIPAITGLDATFVQGGLMAGGRLIAAGALVTVDGGRGTLYAGDRRIAGAADVEEVRTLRRWAAELGIEPGGAARGSSGPASRSIELVELVRAVHLKGMCDAGRAAAALGAGEPSVLEVIAASASFFRLTPRGFVVTPEGRSWLTEQLAEERTRCDGAAAQDCYREFLLLNDRFKALVTIWQTSPEHAPGTAAWTAARAALEHLHRDLGRLVAEAGRMLPRLADYARRFDAALAAIRADDASMLASPLKDSYHTVWFEYHEELISLTGRNRADEPQ